MKRFDTLNFYYLIVGICVVVGLICETILRLNGMSLFH